MNDLRIPLSRGTVLKLKNISHGETEYYIHDEIGRGHSCIVYSGYYLDNLSQKRQVRIKEFYPYKLNLQRNPDGTLTPSSAEESEFIHCRKDFIRSYQIHTQLRENQDTGNYATDPLDIYLPDNYMVYMVFDCSYGTILQYDSSRPITERLKIIKSIASAIAKIHDTGYLYLDLKPENIFLIPETSELIHLFDFDTLYPYKENLLGEPVGSYRISYSDGFAAYEQKMGNSRKVGPYTDVYGIGALLFYLLYGEAPSALDCQSNASYKFPVNDWCNETEISDKFLPRLRDFLRHTIACFYKYRFQSMPDLIDSLQELILLSDKTKPFLKSTSIRPIVNFVGREEELNRIDQWAHTSGSPCFFITGMGGIGKSTLIREYIGQHANEYDSIAFLLYKDSIPETINDDTGLYVNTLHKTPEESKEEYFIRKVEQLCALLHEKKVLLVIDNFEGDINESFHKILNVGWKIIISTRTREKYSAFPSLQLEPITDYNALYQLFSFNAGISIDPSNRPYIDSIIQHTCCHTLIIELIAKQIVTSYISLEDAASLVEDFGFSQIAPEKILFEHDHEQYYDTIYGIIGKLWSSDHLSTVKKEILEFLTLFGLSGIRINRLQEFLKLDTKDEINELIRSGWINRTGSQLSLHPIIEEAVVGWEWGAEEIHLTNDFMKNLVKLLAVDYLKTNGPKQLHDWLHETSSDPQSQWIWDNISKSSDKRAVDLISSAIEYVGSSEDIASSPVIREYSGYARQITTQGVRHEALAQLDSFRYVYVFYLLYVPIEEEDFILENCTLAKEVYDSASMSFKNYVQSEIYYYFLMKLHEKIVDVYLARGDLSTAWEEIQLAKSLLPAKNGLFAAGAYHDMVSSYYDEALGGDYKNDGLDETRKNIISELDIAIHYFTKATFMNRLSFYKLPLAKCMISKTNVMMRSYPDRKAEIKKEFRDTEKIVRKNAAPYSDIMFQFQMISARYYLQYEHSTIKMEESFKKAEEIVKKRYLSDLDQINQILIPRADLYLELNYCEQSAGILQEGISLCESHSEMIPYIRANALLHRCLIDVYIALDNFQKANECIQFIDSSNAEYGARGAFFALNNSLRSYVKGHISIS